MLRGAIPSIHPIQQGWMLDTGTGTRYVLLHDRTWVAASYHTMITMTAPILLLVAARFWELECDCTKVILTVVMKLRQQSQGQSLSDPLTLKKPHLAAEEWYKVRSILAGFATGSDCLMSVWIRFHCSFECIIFILQIDRCQFAFIISSKRPNFLIN